MHLICFIGAPLALLDHLIARPRPAVIYALESLEAVGKFRPASKRISFDTGFRVHIEDDRYLALMGKM